MRSPSLPNRTGGSPASGFPVGSLRWGGFGYWSETFGGNTPAAQSLRTRSPSYGRPTAGRRAAAKRFCAAPTRKALRHYVGPGEMASIRLPALPSYVPWLHGRYPLLGYYGRSDPGRPFRRHLPWFPDSRHQNLPPFCLQPSAVLDQTRSTPSTLAALFCSGFAVRSQARQNRRPNRVHSVRPYGRTALRTGGSLPVALHPGGMAPMQLLSVTGPSVSARSGTFTLLFQCALRRTSAEFIPLHRSKRMCIAIFPECVESGVEAQ